MPQTGSKPRPSRRLAWGVGLLALVMSVLTVYQVHRYGESRPTSADAAAGRTHAVKIHSRTVYLTTGEYASVVTSHVMAVAALGVFLGLLLKSRAKKPRQKQTN